MKSDADNLLIIKKNYLLFYHLVLQKSKKDSAFLRKKEQNVPFEQKMFVQ